jgi:hypothetical protein
MFRLSTDFIRIVILALAFAWVIVASVLSSFQECACPKTITTVHGQSLTMKKDEDEGLKGATKFFATSALPVTIILVALAFALPKQKESSE